MPTGGSSLWPCSPTRPTRHPPLQTGVCRGQHGLPCAATFHQQIVITQPMLSKRAAPLAIAAFLLLPLAKAGPAFHKCVVDGAVTYQQGACAAGGPTAAPPPPSRANANSAGNPQPKNQLSVPPTPPASAGAARALTQSSAAQVPQQAPRTEDSGRRPAGVFTQTAPRSEGAYRCDGRLHCSQMTSCAEAQFFLKNCPGTKVDGDHDGVPCEAQWCPQPRH